ncbi:MAG: DUF6580 family putative transport protein [Pseudomonadota bacterium]
MRKTNLLLLTTIILGAVALRLVPHPPNFAPIAALALFAGATLERRGSAFLVALSAMLLSDLALELWNGTGFHGAMPAVYGSFALTVWLGSALKKRRNLVMVPASSLTASILFFVATNFEVWLEGSLYPRTLPGLLACYTAAVPFFRWTAIGDLAYTAAFFGVYAVARRLLWKEQLSSCSGVSSTR